MLTRKFIKKVPIFTCVSLEILIFDDFKDLKDKYLDIENLSGFVSSKDTVISVGIISTTETSVIAHESLHVKNALFQIIGQKTDSINDEVDAYLIECAFIEIQKVFQAHNKLKNK